MSFGQKLRESRHLIPVVLLIAAVLGSIYSGIATATEAAARWRGGLADPVGGAGLAELADLPRFACWARTRLYCMIALILAGAAFLTL